MVPYAGEEANNAFHLNGSSPPGARLAGFELLHTGEFQSVLCSTGGVFRESIVLLVRLTVVTELAGQDCLPLGARCLDVIRTAAAYCSWLASR